MPNSGAISEERFWAKVEKTDGCWIWTAAKTHGHGVFGVNGRNRYAHILAYELLVGPVPDGLDLDHLCRNRACVRPDHLEPVTRRVNLLRGETIAARHAAKTHCPQGHPYEPPHVRIVQGPNGPQRQCRTCDRDRQRARRAAARAARLARNEDDPTDITSPTMFEGQADDDD